MSIKSVYSSLSDFSECKSRSECMYYNTLCVLQFRARVSAATKMEFSQETKNWLHMSPSLSNHLTVLDFHGGVDHAHRRTKVIANALWPHASPTSTRISDTGIEECSVVLLLLLLLLLPLLLLEELAVVPAALRAVGALRRRDPLHQDGDLDRLVLPARRNLRWRRRRWRRVV